jgi:hypothetical protein
MKKLTIKWTNISKNGKTDEKVSYLDFIRMAVSAPPPGKGFVYEDMRKAFRIIDVVEKAEKDKATEIVFEDTDAEVLKQHVKQCQWAMLDRDVMAFCNAVVDM